MIQRLEPPENSVHPKSRAQWRRWLERNHARTEGVWLVTYKKGLGQGGGHGGARGLARALATRIEETARLAAMKIPPPQWIRK